MSDKKKAKKPEQKITRLVRFNDLGSHGNHDFVLAPNTPDFLPVKSRTGGTTYLSLAFVKSAHTFYLDPDKRFVQDEQPDGWRVTAELEWPYEDYVVLIANGLKSEVTADTIAKQVMYLAREERRCFGRAPDNFDFKGGSGIHKDDGGSIDDDGKFVL